MSDATNSTNWSKAKPVWHQTCFRSVFLSSNSEVTSAFFQGSGVCPGIVRILDLQEQISYKVCSGACQRAPVTVQPTLPTLPTTRCIEGRLMRYRSGQKQYHIELPRLGSHLCRQHPSSCHQCCTLSRTWFSQGSEGTKLRINCRSAVHYDGVSSAALRATLYVSENSCQ